MAATILLQPGDLAVSCEGDVLRTILGSCIAVCVFDRRQNCGGMNHFVLPELLGTKSVAEAQPENRYAEPSIRNLLKALKGQFGCRKEDLVVKLVGGASLTVQTSEGIHAGAANREAAHRVLKQFGLKVSAEKTGGFVGLEVEFNSSTGELRIKPQESTTAKRQAQVSSGRAEPLGVSLKPNTAPISASSGSAVAGEAKASKIRVLIVDDSLTCRRLLRKDLEQDSRFLIVGEAADPFEAIEIRKTVPIDVMTLDINMPRMDGVTYLKQFMRSDPVPAVIVTDYNLEASGPVFDALENGAFDYVKKPSIEEVMNRTDQLPELLFAAYNGGKKMRKRVPIAAANTVQRVKVKVATTSELTHELIVLGASTGGTEAIKDFLSGLPDQIPPILIVQHIPPIFSKAFADRLDRLFNFQVKEAEEGDWIQRNTVYIAPGNRHMRIAQKPNGLRVEITDDPHVNRFRPSVDYLFDSAVQVKKAKLLAILMTGMGSDGAKGLLRLRQMGAHTIAQDEASSVVFGMPKAAIELGAAEKILPLDKIASRVVEWSARRKAA